MVCINSFEHTQGYTKEFVSINENELVLLKSVLYFEVCILSSSTTFNILRDDCSL